MIYWIGEHAHIYAYEADGPRGSVDYLHNNNFENLLVLCPSCHTLIDKYKQDYPAPVLLEWKKTRIGIIEASIRKGVIEESEIPYTATLEFRYEQIVYAGGFILQESTKSLFDILQESYELLLESSKEPSLIQIFPDAEITEEMIEKIVLTLLIGLQQDIGSKIYYIYPDNMLRTIDDMHTRKGGGKIIFLTDIEKMQIFIPFPNNPDFLSRVIFISRDSYPGAKIIPLKHQNITPFLLALGSK
ncbi:hypothetical protein KA057_02005 [Candidatus Gracilibacteria bacterium]|nr:hypothetical protein [Candidatus Gracilibacteria bacterium]